MFDINQVFRSEEGQAERRQFAAFAALTVVIGHLHRLPGSGEFIGPMDALWHAYQGLCEGSSHPLFENYEGKAGGRRLTIAQQLLQGRAVGMLEILFDAGWREQDAVEKVTNVLVACGVKGTRRKAVLTRSGLRNWRTKANSGDSPHIRNYADHFKTLHKATFELATGRPWPPSKQEAQRLIEIYLQNQAFRDLAASASV